MKSLGRNFFYIFVLLKDENKPEYWIVPQPIVAKTTELDYQKWIKGRPIRSKKAPRTLQWERLHSKGFAKYYNKWEILKLW